MIKIGVFGLSGETIYLSRKIIKEKKEQAISGYYVPGRRPDQGSVNRKLPTVTDPEDIIHHSDALVFADPDAEQMSFIRTALRGSKPLFFINTRHLSIKALHEIQELADEAETSAFCYNPVWYNETFSEAVRIVPGPSFTEFAYGVPPRQFQTRTIIKHLQFALETTLKLNNSFPRKPVVGAYSTGSGHTDLIHIHLEFDNGGVALFRYEGISVKNRFSCKLIHNGDIVLADLIAGIIRHQQMKPEGTPPVHHTAHQSDEETFYRSWNYFLAGDKTANIDIEDRLATTRLFRFISEKIMNKTIAGVVQ